MTNIQHLLVVRSEKAILDALENFTQALKAAYIGETVETIVGRHTVRCKVIDSEDGKLVLDNGARREWRKVEPVVICDGQDEAQQDEAGDKEVVG